MNIILGIAIALFGMGILFSGILNAAIVSDLIERARIASFLLSFASFVASGALFAIAL